MRLLILAAVFSTFAISAQGVAVVKDLASDVENAKLMLEAPRRDSQDYLAMMDKIEEILWTGVQPYVSIIQENLPSIQISLADVENIQIQINQASSVLVYQAKLQGKALVRHLRYLNATEVTLNSNIYDNLAENRENLVAQMSKITSVKNTAMDLSASEVVMFNNLLDSILEGQTGSAVDEIQSAMAGINLQMEGLGADIDSKANTLEGSSNNLVLALDVVIAQVP